MTVNQIEKALLKLDMRSRAQLAEKLLQSLDNLSDAENEQLWAREALRRHEEMAGGKVKGKPVAKVLREARSHLK